MSSAPGFMYCMRIRIYHMCSEDLLKLMNAGHQFRDVYDI